MILNPSIIAQVFLQSPEMLPAAMAVTLGILIAVIWIYPGQLRFVRWPWRGLLPLLRVAALVALSASLLKPVAARLASAAERGVLLVLIDKSRSMSIVDNARSERELVSLADALGRLPA